MKLQRTGILIAGPARCGKSTVAAVLAQDMAKIAVLRVDALLPAFRTVVNPTTIAGRKKFIKDYLLRPRYMDPARLEVRCPADDMGDAFTAVLAKAKQLEASTPAGLIFATLDAWASESGRMAWVVPDLHAEIYFHEFIRDYPGLRMIVLLRDPREAIVASLYWRTYPQRIVGGRKNFVYKLLLWCLAAETGRRLERKFPRQVSVFWTHALKQPAASDRRLGSLFPDITISAEGINTEDMYFSYVDNYGWLCPDGNRREILSEKEKIIIGAVCRPWFDPGIRPVCDPFATVIVIAIRAMLVAVLTVAKYRPGLSKNLLDWSFFPLAYASRFCLGAARRILKRS